MDIVFIIVGLILLVVGGDKLVSGAAALASHLGVSPMLIGLTVVGFGTSMPELVTSVQAALVGAEGVSIGNVVGSNIANVFLILGLSAMIAPIAANRNLFLRDSASLLVASALITAITLTGTISRLAGGGLLIVLAAYLIFTIRSDPGSSPDLTAGEVQPRFGVSSMAAIIIGVFGCVFGAYLLVRGAVGISIKAGIPDEIIGLTIVAIGTSLPELITSLAAARKGQGDIAIGNVFGSNIFNILGILGVTAVIQPLAVPTSILRIDIWVMLASTVLIVLMARTGWRLTRLEGTILALGYAAYLGRQVSLL